MIARLLFTSLAFTLATSAAARPPNIIVILVDDQGYYDLGCYGATEVETPNIDRLAAEGTRFTTYYAAAPICSPSRVGLLTGCYPKRLGLATWVQRADSKLGIHPDERTLPELFKPHGYATACIGKWHLGKHPEFHPLAQGFDHYFGLLHNLDPVETLHFEAAGGVPLMRGHDVVERPANPNKLTAQYTDEAIRFIEKNTSSPFFLYLPHTMLHNPLGVSEAFRGTSEWGDYGDAIQELDANVGRLVATLEKHALTGNTVVLYLSDNGRGPGRIPSQPLRGRKLSTLEAGIRVPAIAWAPGLGIRAGHTENRITSALDWLPTLATLAGIEVPTDRPIDGRDLTPTLLTKPQTKPLNAEITNTRTWDPPLEWRDIVPRDHYRDAFFIHGSQGALAAVRWQNYKLVLNPSLQLYDLDADPAESKLVRNGTITRKLRGMAVLFQEEMTIDARPPGIHSD